MEEKDTLGRFLKRKREEKSLTQKEMAQRLFVTESAVSKWERGISYPDISLVSQICAVLSISEHELITASEDEEQKKLERQAAAYQKTVHCYSVAMLVIYAVSLPVCFIVNLAVEHRISWFWVVLGGELTAFSLLSLPLYVKKRRAAVTLGCFWLSLQILLFICAVYTGGGWFFVAMWSVTLGFSVVFLPFVLVNLPLPGVLYRNKALLCITADTVLLFIMLASAMHYAGNMDAYFTLACPVAAAGLSYVWVLLVIVRYLNIHPYFRAAVALGFSGFYCLVINNVLYMIIDHKPFALQPFDLRIWRDDAYINGNTTMILFLICIVLTVVFSVGGVLITVKGRNPGSGKKSGEETD